MSSWRNIDARKRLGGNSVIQITDMGRQMVKGRWDILDEVELHVSECNRTRPRRTSDAIARLSLCQSPHIGLQERKKGGDTHSVGETPRSAILLI